jgi:hypothetical protein
MFENLSSKQLNRAAQIKERIESLQSELEQIVTGGTSSSSSYTPAATAPSGKGKGPISAAGLAKIKAAQKARWAKYRKEKGITTNGTSASVGNAKRTMSPAAKAKIRAAAKLRWAKAKAAGRTSL